MERGRFSRRDHHGKDALTRYRLLEQRKRFCIVEVEPVTGRTNQIRIHFKHIGHPLVGERKYAFGRDHALKFRRVALHASTLRWIHPVMNTKVSVNASLAQDMEVFLARNRN